MKTNQWMRVGVVVAACAVALTFAADEPKPDAGAAKPPEFAEVVRSSQECFPVERFASPPLLE